MGLLKKAFQPITDEPSKLANRLANKIDTPRMPSNAGGFLGKYGEFGDKLNAQGRGFLAGALQGAGNLVSDMTSPVALATMAAGPALSGMRTPLKLIPKIAQAAEGINPAMLSADMIPVGSEAAYNAPRLFQATKEAERLGDIAYEGSKVANKLPMPRMNKMNVAEEMAKLKASRSMLAKKLVTQ